MNDIGSAPHGCGGLGSEICGRQHCRMCAEARCSLKAGTITRVIAMSSGVRIGYVRPTLPLHRQRVTVFGVLCTCNPLRVRRAITGLHDQNAFGSGGIDLGVEPPIRRSPLGPGRRRLNGRMAAENAAVAAAHSRRVCGTSLSSALWQFANCQRALG